MVGTLEPEAWPQPQEGLGQHRMLQPPHRSTPPHTQVSILLDEYLIISGGRGNATLGFSFSLYCNFVCFEAFQACESICFLPSFLI